MKATKVKAPTVPKSPEKECVVCKKKTRYPYARVNGDQFCCSNTCYETYNIVKSLE